MLELVILVSNVLGLLQVVIRTLVSLRVDSWWPSRSEKMLHYRLRCPCFISISLANTILFIFHFISFRPHFIVLVSFYFLQSTAHFTEEEDEEGSNSNMEDSLFEILEDFQISTKPSMPSSLASNTMLFITDIYCTEIIFNEENQVSITYDVTSRGRGEGFVTFWFHLYGFLSKLLLFFFFFLARGRGVKFLYF